MTCARHRVEALELVVVGIGNVDEGGTILGRRRDAERVLQARLTGHAVDVAEVEETAADQAPHLIVAPDRRCESTLDSESAT